MRSFNILYINQFFFYMSCVAMANRYNNAYPTVARLILTSSERIPLFFTSWEKCLRLKLSK